MLSTINNILTPSEIDKLLGQRLQSLRLQAGYKRTSLAQRAGVSVASLKRFETSGQISLQNLLRLAHALDRLSEFSNLFIAPVATSLSDLRHMSRAKTPKRGRI